MQKGMTSNFTNESEYQTLLEEAFFTKPEEIVFALSIGTDYTTALNRAKEIPIKPPYVEITTVDLIYFGLCATVHLEILRAYMVEKGEISEDSIDSEFFGLIWVKVKLSFCDYRILKYIIIYSFLACNKMINIQYLISGNECNQHEIFCKILSCL